MDKTIRIQIDNDYDFIIVCSVNKQKIVYPPNFIERIIGISFDKKIKKAIREIETFDKMIEELIESENLSENNELD